MLARQGFLPIDGVRRPYIPDVAPYVGGLSVSDAFDTAYRDVSDTARWASSSVHVAQLLIYDMLSQNVKGLSHFHGLHFEFPEVL
jgi:hypothetical protein